MSKRHHIRAIGNPQNLAHEDDAALDEVYELVEEEPAAWPQSDEEVADLPASPRSARVAAALVLLAAVGWSGYFVFAHRVEMFAGAPPQQWAAWISQWSIPLILLSALWLVAMRNSAREAERFGVIAHSLSRESALVEQRIAVVNRELSLAREFLATQSRELEYLGRSASERISAHAGELQSLVLDNGQQLDRISGVSATALENMTKLRDSMPVIANSARDVSNQIGSAGRTASAQLGELVAGFERLNEFGLASERQVASLRARIDEAIAAFAAQADQLQTVADARFAALRTESETFRGELDSREVEALASIHARAEALRTELAETQAASTAHHSAAFEALSQRLQALTESAGHTSGLMRETEEAALAAWTGQIEALQQRLKTAVEDIAALDERALAGAQAKLLALTEEAQAVDARLADRNRLFDQELGERRRRIEADEDAAGEALAARLAAFDAAITERREIHRSQLVAIENEAEALAERVATLGAVFAAVQTQGNDARTVLAGGISALSTSLAETREALDGTDMALGVLTDSSVRLLELIQASAKQARHDLPEAVAVSETRLSDVEARSRAIHEVMAQAREAGATLEAAILASDTRTRDVAAALEAIENRLAATGTAQSDALAAVRSDLAAFSSESEAIAARVQDQLRQALSTLRDSARGALDALDSEQQDRIAELSSSIGKRSAAAIADALAGEARGAISDLEASARRSAEASREAALQLRDQLVKVNELASNLENRIAHARERAEDQVDNDFARRVALITESLNSNAIDIAKALSSEVTDTAWASYLRGDRGIFTRRAVRLLDNTEARDIAELYDADRDFRDHVNRYIHDFEAMLRTLLSTRDGHAVSVTLLSSDMGKLYVVLAQALERLRQ